MYLVQLLMASEGCIHDSDLDLSDDEDDACMSTAHPFQTTLCCGLTTSRTCNLRGDSTNLCQLVTTALTSSDCRDSLNMPSIQDLLVDFAFISSNDIKKLIFFNDSRISLVEDYIERLMVSRQQLKDLARVSDNVAGSATPHSGVFETAGDVLFEINCLNWLTSKPQRCCKGASGSNIVVAVNEVINCINEVKQLRKHFKCDFIQEKLNAHLACNWKSYQMCRDCDCDRQKRYRTYVTNLSNKSNEGRRNAKSSIILPYNVDAIIVTDLISLVIDDSPLNSGSYYDCENNFMMGSPTANINSKRSRSAIGAGMIINLVLLFRFYILIPTHSIYMVLQTPARHCWQSRNIVCRMGISLPRQNCFRLMNASRQ